MNFQFIYSIIAGIFIAGVAGYLGSLMLSKRMALVAGPLGHLAMPGIALALLYGFDVSLGAFPFIILGIILIWLFEMRTKLPMEALTAVVFSSGVASAFLFLPIKEAQKALVGDITKVNLGEALMTVTLCFLVFFITKKIYSKMVLINVSEDLAKAEKISVSQYNFFYLGAIAIIIALGVKVVGGLLTAALVAIPASSAKNLSKNLFQYVFLATFFGVTSAFLGILLFKITRLPAGPLIILTNTLIFLISMIFKKRVR